MQAVTAASADVMWADIHNAHPDHHQLGSRGPLAGRPGHGCLYVADLDAAVIYAVLSTSPRRAWDQLVDNAVTASRSDAIWVPGRRTAIRAASPILSQPGSALARGRPSLIRSDADWARAPRRAGIYRIHRIAADGLPEVYVGKSLLFTRRPRHHEKTKGRMWGDAPGNVSMIELIGVRACHGASVWTNDDLSRAEERHVTKMVEAYGADRVLNITSGGNGRTGTLPDHFAVWEPDPA